MNSTDNEVSESASPIDNNPGSVPNQLQGGRSESNLHLVELIKKNVLIKYRGWVWIEILIPVVLTSLASVAMRKIVEQDEHKLESSKGSRMEISGMIALGLIYYTQFVFTFMASRLVSAVAGERESRARELMRIMGVKERYFYLSWVIVYLMIYGIISFAMALLLTFVGSFDYINFFGLLLALFLYSVSSGSLSLLISAPFNTTKSASRAAWMISLLISFLSAGLLAGIMGTLLEARANAKHLAEHPGNPRSNIFPSLKLYHFLALSLSPQLAISLALLSLTGLLPHHPAWFIAMMGFASLMYFLIYIYLDLTLPHTFGIRLPWNFFLKS
jgi:hypothetical protein